MFLVIVKYIILTSDTLELVQYGVIFLNNLTVKRLDCELMPSLRENDLESASSIICFVRIATKILNTQRKLLPCISYFSFSLRSASVTLLQWEEICLAQLSVLVNLLSLYRVYVYRDDVFLLSRDIYHKGWLSCGRVWIITSIFLLPLTMSIHTPQCTINSSYGTYGDKEYLFHNQEL